MCGGVGRVVTDVIKNTLDPVDNFRACRGVLGVSSTAPCDYYHTTWASQNVELLESNMKLSVGFGIISGIRLNKVLIAKER